MFEREPYEVEEKKVTMDDDDEDTCEVCGKEAWFQCTECLLFFCEDHYNLEESMCNDCLEEN